MEDLGDVEESDNVAIIVTYGLPSAKIWGLQTYEMSKALAYHELKSFSRTRRIPCDHGVFGHDLCDCRISRIKRFGSNLDM